MCSDDVFELSPMNFAFIFCHNAVTNSINMFSFFNVSHINMSFYGV